MNLTRSVRQIWNPVFQKLPTAKGSVKTVGKISTKLLTSVLSITTFFILLIARPQKITIAITKTAEKFGKIKIPTFLRRRFFKAYARYYKVKLEDIVDPLESFDTFNSFFTRKIKPRSYSQDSRDLLIPADSKILKITEVIEDQVSLIKGSSYSVSELLTGQKQKWTSIQVAALKKRPENHLYQVVFYLAPGDYHRFHCPAQIDVYDKKFIDGLLLGVSEKVLIKRKKVYEKNKRVYVNAQWNQGYMGLVMVGALNVGNITIQQGNHFDKASELGFFNLGSTIVMLFEANKIQSWNVKEGDKVEYGSTLCRIIPQKKTNL